MTPVEIGETAPIAILFRILYPPLDVKINIKQLTPF